MNVRSKTKHGVPRMNTKPPFRADQVGSLLRPPELRRLARPRGGASSSVRLCGRSKTAAFATWW